MLSEARTVVQLHEEFESIKKMLRTNDQVLSFMKWANEKLQGRVDTTNALEAGDVHPLLTLLTWYGADWGNHRQV